MKFTLPRLFAALALPALASACEGECIVKITEAWLSNYTLPLHTIWRETAQQLSSLVYEQGDAHHGFEYLAPLVHAYTNASYEGMRTAIFPSFFHGKCQQNGVDPPGCPNPDCPVVCGTPGSMVHFYPVLRQIAFNQTRALISNATEQYSDAIAQRVVQDAKKDNVKHAVKAALGEMGDKLLKQCGGDGLPDCNWEQEMKEYILTFP
ncbi:hypothetical protein EV122DRAFT_217219 [Schizophyllum commune]|nr:hypothetical protein K523DRAFT_294273 [Schizophyllum commune Tattone D]